MLLAGEAKIDLELTLSYLLGSCKRFQQAAPRWCLRQFQCLPTGVVKGVSALMHDKIGVWFPIGKAGYRDVATLFDFPRARQIPALRMDGPESSRSTGHVSTGIGWLRTIRVGKALREKLAGRRRFVPVVSVSQARLGAMIRDDD